MLPSKRRHRIFLTVYLLVVVAVTLPVIPAVWSGRVLFLGLPASFLWVIAALAVIFAAVSWLFVTEDDEPAPGKRTRAS